MRRAVAVVTAMLMCTAALTVAGTGIAAACKSDNYHADCVASTKKGGKEGTRTVEGGGGNQPYLASQSSSTPRRTGPSVEEVYRKKQKAYVRAADDYQRSLVRYRWCIDRLGTPVGFRSGCGSAPTVPKNLPSLTQVSLLGDPPPPGGGPVVTITPAQAGAIAVARLRITAAAPRIGPDPKVNKWKVAVVGYPLWLWTDGPSHIGPVGENVAGLSVSLDARLSKTVFLMGDGNSVTCQGTGTRYSSSVKPGAKSPTCGYVYEKPSLPGKNYTVTAISYWDVTWTVNGTSGTETVPLVATRELPVGEVQVLRR